MQHRVQWRDREEGEMMIQSNQRILYPWVGWGAPLFGPFSPMNYDLDQRLS